MVVHTCPSCKKEFNKKSTYDYHVQNKKSPCEKNDVLIAPNCSNNAPNCSNNAPINSNVNIMDILDIIIGKNDNGNININDKIISCMYCDKTFTRNTNLQRHLNNRCKSKENYDELEKLKKDMKLIIDNYQNLENNYQKIENENMDLKNKIDEIEIVQNGGNTVINNDNKTINNNNNKTINQTNNSNNNNQINKGVILNNTVNIQVVQFGNEDIDKLNLIDAMKSYLKSTGGNIASNMLKYINLNEQYPENNNICMTDLSREIVKIHNGKKFVYKKFKNVKDELLTKIVTNTRKIVNKYENDVNLKKSNDTKSKLKINDVSLKIIDGISAEDIVREEIKEQEKMLIKNKIVENNNLNINNVANDETSESEEEREFTLEERLRIDHLENKRDGMQKKTFENIKDELYNAKELTESLLKIIPL